MKFLKSNLAKNIIFLIIPILNLILIIGVSAMFSQQITVENDNILISEEKKKNEKIVSVYFHKTDEIKEMKLEEYLIGVIPAEMPPSFELEALKAQAVAARTFIINREGLYNDEKHKGATVCTDSTHCKAYMSDGEADEKWGTEWEKTYKNKIRKAVQETEGQIVTYNNEPISAVFHSTSSGMTENSEDVWQSALPYLRSVESEGEEESPRYTSEVTVNYTDFKNKLKEADSSVSFSQNPKEWIGNITYNDSGSVKTIVLGNKEFKGVNVRSIFGLRSANFKIEAGENITFYVTGNGHGVGMSQYGANYAAKNGYTYDKILKKYYQGVEIKDMNNISK